ncbi:hypothetical protein Clacol_008046 [Clathrus columnatus]|uniref:Uncharacterized protein n=1 Tax=Clathrus columnatus TaxID=1419009 RepID=A0AAV5AKX7_9AGAM|nr:hypothetical protein Clacol_008046 [Clathrus columnatus]
MYTNDHYPGEKYRWQTEVLAAWRISPKEVQTDYSLTNQLESYYSEYSKKQFKNAFSYAEEAVKGEHAALAFVELVLTGFDSKASAFGIEYS